MSPAASMVPPMPSPVLPPQPALNPQALPFQAGHDESPQPATPEKPARQGSAGQQGVWCAKFSRTDASGAVYVRAPWLDGTVTKDSVRLGDELVSLARLAALSPAEVACRQLARLSVQTAVRGVWADAVTKLCGAEAFGLGAPGAPLRLCVEDCGDAAMCRAAVVEKLTVAGAAVSEAAGGLTCAIGGIPVEVAFDLGRSTDRLRVAALQRRLKMHPAAGPVTCAFSTVLGQVRCNEAAPGGLSREACLAMVLHVCERRQVKAGRRGESLADACAALLLDVFKYYDGFDFAAFSINAASPDPVPRGADDGAAISIVDPAAAGGNLAAGFTKLTQLRGSVFQFCHQALMKYDGAVPTGSKRGYKGRTQLATIVSIQPLWERARQVNGCGADDVVPASGLPPPAAALPPTPAKLSPARIDLPSIPEIVV